MRSNLENLGQLLNIHVDVFQQFPFAVGEFEVQNVEDFEVFLREKQIQIFNICLWREHQNIKITI